MIRVQFNLNMLVFYIMYSSCSFMD